MSWPDPIPSSGHQLRVACQSKPASDSSHACADSDNAHHSMVSKFDKEPFSWKLWYQYCPRVTHCHEQRNQFTFIVEILYMPYKIGLDEDLKFLRVVRSAYVAPLILDAASLSFKHFSSVQGWPGCWIWMMGSGQCIMVSVIRADSSQ